MAKKKKNKDKKFNLPSLKAIIAAILVIVVGLILFLGLLGKAGKGGELIARHARGLFGVGVYFVPVVLVGIGFFVFSSKKWHWLKATGLFIFGVSILGLLGLIDSETGGLIGKATVGLLRKVFDFWGSLVILGAVFLISALSTFSFPYQFLNLLRRRRKEQESEEEEGEKKTRLVKRSIPGLDKLKQSDAEKEKEEKSSGESEKKKSPTKELTGDEDQYIPPLDLLEDPPNKGRVVSRNQIKNSKAAIKDTFSNFGIEVEMDEVNAGPTVTQYTFEPEEGVKLSKIEGLQKDLSLALAAHPLRIEAPIPGRSLVGIEVPNDDRQEVRLKELLQTDEFQKHDSPLTVPLGRNVSGEPVCVSLEGMPHLLIAGATGSGKSVGIHNIINSLLYQNSPKRLRLILSDPKRVELVSYNGIPHLLTPVISKPKKTINALKWAISEMERRYDFLSEVKARNLKSLNDKLSQSDAVRSYAEEEGLLEAGEQIPYIVIIIDELADIMNQFGNEMESVVVRLAQMARAVGIHLVLSTQRPSVEVITGLIKANITTRIAFQVASQVDSRTILDRGGAEQLMGDGDMLFQSGDSSEPERIQGVFVSEEEVKNVVKYLKKQPSLDILKGPGEKDTASSIEQEIDQKGKEVEDELYPEAKKIVIEADKGSASLLQRKLRIGYARAARLLDMMEEEGIVGPARGSKARKVKANEDQFDFD